LHNGQFSRVMPDSIEARALHSKMRSLGKLWKAVAETSVCAC
jgi:hypothetical protein